MKIISEDVLDFNGVQITKDMAEDYEDLRQSGACNMFGAKSYLGWSSKELSVFFQDDNYSKMMEHWNIT